MSIKQVWLVTSSLLSMHNCDADYPEVLDTIEGLRVDSELGHGNFSTVFKGFWNDQAIAIKVLTGNYETSFEQKILNDIQGCPNALKAIDVGFKDECIFFFEYLEALPEDIAIKQMSPDNLRFLARSLLECMASVHEKGIIHNDIKLANIIITTGYESVKLVDWGCACYVRKTMSPMIGSRLIRSPEMLMQYRKFDTRSDVWAVGVLIYDILTDQKLPWIASNPNNQLIELSKIFGGNNIVEYAKTLNITLKPDIIEKFSNEPVSALEDFIQRNDLVSDQLINLLKQLLTLDFNSRPFAKDILQHPYFH